MKKIKSILVFVLLLFVVFLFSFKDSLAVTLVPLNKVGGGTVTYRNTSTNVLIPSSYETQKEDLRAVWVSRYISDLTFSSEYTYKTNYSKVLDKMEEMNLNTIIYHVRPNHDALYNSTLNVRSKYLNQVNSAWDSLKWVIEETHKRGIEFHAWLNPYRIQNTGATSASSIASEYTSPNVASNPENILVADGKAILNPGEPAVRQFLIDTVMEIIENYDVDAIHFDDYFYIANVNDTTTRQKLGYNPKGLSVDDWRREQVNIFIQDLSSSIRAHNIANNKYVQLGISPTGIYKNGGSGFAEGGVANYNEKGNFVTNGSNTIGQEHYKGYLYADTKKWIDEEWIDYIMPQTYWGFEHELGPYADVVDWWAKVVKNKKVNLYTGMGLHMGSGGSWDKNPYEASNQVLYNTKHPEVKGVSIFSYKTLLSPPGSSGSGINRIKNEMWNKKALRPMVRTIARSPLPKVTNASFQKQSSGYKLTWNALNQARGYAIYRSTGAINFNDSSQIIDILGFDSASTVTYIDSVNNSIEYNYGVRAIDGANQLGTGLVLGQNNDFYTTTVSDNKTNNLLSVYHSEAAKGLYNHITASENASYRYMFLTQGNKVITKEKTYNFFTVSNQSFKGYYVSSGKIGVAFVNRNNDLISFQEVSNASEINSPMVPNTQDGYKFSHWSVPLDKVTKDTIIKAVYIKENPEMFNVTINDGSGSKNLQVEYGSTITLTPHSSVLSYFNHWKVNNKIASYNSDYTISVYTDLTIQAVTGSEMKKPLANIVDEAISLDSSVAFVGGYYIPSTVDFVEVGMLIYKGFISDFDFQTPNVLKVKALKISQNNEFSIIMRNVNLGEVVNAKTYLMYRESGEIKTVFSSITKLSSTNNDHEILTSLVNQVPRHITSDYTFPQHDNVIWSYQAGQDQSLFNLNTGKLLKQKLTYSKRVLEASLNDVKITFEVNFGILLENEVGSFYRNNPAILSKDEGSSAEFFGWSGYTLTKGSFVHFVSQAIELNGSGLITDTNILNPEGGRTSVGTLYVNVGTKSIRFTISSLGTRVENSAYYSKVIVGADGRIKRIINTVVPGTEEITLLPGEAFWTPKYLDKDGGLTFASEYDFTDFEYLRVKKY